MARSVKDAAYLLQAIAGVDSNDNYTSAIPNDGTLPDYVAACDYSSLAGKRIGVAWNVLDIWGPVDEPVMAAFQESIALIERAGATIVTANFTAFPEYVKDDNETLVLNGDFLVNLNSYLSELSYNPTGVMDLTDVRNFTQKFMQEDWPDRDTAVWDDALDNQGWNNTDPRFWAAYQVDLYYGGPGGILGALEDNNVSAVILPTQFSPAIPALVGSPVVTVPMGFYPATWPVTYDARETLVATGPRVPFGLSFMGRKFDEATLIGLAYAYEQRTMHRNDVQPYIVPNIELGDFVN
jgi:amidase